MGASGGITRRDYRYVNPRFESYVATENYDPESKLKMRHRTSELEKLAPRVAIKGQVMICFVKIN